jgi:hypothetical protein
VSLSRTLLLRLGCRQRDKCWLECIYQTVTAPSVARDDRQIRFASKVSILSYTAANRCQVSNDANVIQFMLSKQFERSPTNPYKLAAALHITSNTSGNADQLHRMFSCGTECRFTGTSTAENTALNGNMPLITTAGTKAALLWQQCSHKECGRRPW